MTNKRLTDLTARSAPALTDLLYVVDTTDTTDSATGSSRQLSTQRLFGFLKNISQGRLTGATATPNPSSSITSSTIYYSPFNGNLVSLYDGTRWKLFTFTERSLALSGLTTGKKYDVFLYDNSGTLALEKSAAWVNDTTRTDAITLQDGVYVKSGALTRRLVGTFKAASSSTFNDDPDTPCLNTYDFYPRTFPSSVTMAHLKLTSGLDVGSLSIDPTGIIAGTTILGTSVGVTNGGFASVFQATLTNDRAITLPDATGTLALTSNPLTSFAAPTGDLSMNSHKITNLTTPTSSTDAANKSYVDTVSTGLDAKRSVRVATTASGTLSTAFANGQTIDGVTLATGDRILIKDQSTATENGIYLVPVSGSPTRTTDANTGALLESAYLFVQEGTVNKDKGFVCTTDSITIGSTSIVFVNFNSSGGGLIAANNLSDLANVATARTNLGLGTAATMAGPSGAIVGTTDAQAITNKSYNGLTISSTTGTLTITNGKTAAVSNTLTFTGTDGSSVNCGAGGTVAYLDRIGQTFTANITFGGTIDMSSNTIDGLADPTGPQNAATKAYVDAVANGMDYKLSCLCATTANITLSGEQTIDGITTSTSRILVKNQTTGSQNGIYNTASGSWTRATDADANAEVTSGLCTFVSRGTINGGTSWALTTIDTITVGTTALVFTQVGGPGSYTAGSGLTLTGTQFSVQTLNQNTTGSAATLTTGRTISVSGDIAYTSPAFDGSVNVTAAGTLATVNSNVGSFGSGTQVATFTVNAKGLVTAASNTPISIPTTAISDAASAATASVVAKRDANANCSFVNVLEGFRSTATAAGTTTLTVSDAFQQFFTGSTTQTVAMPVATTLVNGQSWLIVNNSTGDVTVQSSGGNTIVVLAGSTSAVITCINTGGGTGTASWSYQYIGDVVTSGKKLAVSNSLTLVGTDGTTITFQGTDTYVGRATTDTLVNKTLTNPRVDAHDANINAITDAATITMDLAVSDLHSVSTLGANRTIAVSNTGTNKRFGLIILDNTGNRTLTWFSGITWLSTNSQPASGAKISVFSFIKTGSGAYLGSCVQQP